MTGCTFVMHVASPLYFKVPKDEYDLIVPAVEGTKCVLAAAQRAGAIAGALAGSPTCASICRTVAGSVMNPTTRTRPPHPLHLSGATP